MLFLRSLLFNFFLYTGIIVVFLIAIPALFLPVKITCNFKDLPRNNLANTLKKIAVQNS